MANRLKMAKVNAILQLRERGWSFRRIARELGVHRDTVSRVVREAVAGANPAKVTLGAEGESPSEPAKVPLGIPASRSQCEPFRAEVLAKLEPGLSAQRIWQDLRDEQAFTASYSCVKRFVRRLGKGWPLPFRRMECEPGQQAQVDFGRGAPVVGADGKRRFPHVFRTVLSHSRNLHQFGVPWMAFNFAEYHIRNPVTPLMIGQRWLFTGIGAAVMWGLVFLRHNVAWRPVHYIGFVMGDAWVMAHAWWSVFLGWLAKYIILWVGGANAYRRCIPVFLGLLFGQFMCGGFWMALDFCAGIVGDYVYIGA